MIGRGIGGLVYLIIFFGSITVNMFEYFILAATIIAIFEITKLIKSSKKKTYNIFYGIFFLGGLGLMYHINEVRVEAFLYLTLTIMFTDTFAFLVGKSIGKTPFSKLSPNKTLEGFIGALILGPLFSFFFMNAFTSNASYLVGGLTNNLILIYIIAVVYSFVGQFGDLAESKAKRIADKKDSGTIIYGHGGIMDRLDSLVAGSYVASILMIL